MVSDSCLAGKTPNRDRRHPEEILGDEKKRALLRWAMAVYLESLAVGVVGDLLEGMGFGAEVERLGIDEQAIPEGFEELLGPEEEGD